MKIVDFLKRENCVASLSSTDKEEALRELCDLLRTNGDVEDGPAIFDAVINRERLGSTGIGDHVAIPHAKTPEVEYITAAFGLSRSGVEYFAVDDKPVRLIFLLVASDNATGVHLKALARISRLLKSDTFRKEIENVKSPEEIYETIEREDIKLG
ncbi:PTS IIA-like nitrogen-regulatory protein PtsN [hydrothermal vent metagenome]|uniref:PTS IIA-like nitrogen-regulatory protein PtsN n=1 Tax=hydrothermal vent metagenome TaxID=652676 RepID=A0A3B1BYC6_9ZZZZ